MKKFIVELFSNRFGIILAALNLCYFASRGDLMPHAPFGKFFAAANSPALVSTIVSLEFAEIFVHKLSLSTENFTGNLFLAGFMIAQWLFIGWFSYALAARIRQTAWWKNHDIRW